MPLERKQKFYKYQSFNPKCCGHCKTNLENFLNQKIYSPPAITFNDPFEGVFVLKSIKPQDLEQYPEAFNFHLQAAQKENSQLTEEEYRKMIKSEEFSQALIADKKFISNLFSNHEVFCLTQDNSK